MKAFRPVPGTLGAISRLWFSPGTQTTLAWILLLAFFARAFHWIKISGDFAYYLIFGELVLSGQDIYVAGGPGTVTWPPVFGLLCVPFSLLARVSPALPRAVWVLLNLAALIVILKILVRMVYGKSLAMSPSRGRLSPGSPEVLIPLILSLRFVLSNFSYLQVNILILALTLGGLFWHSRGRDIGGGILIGLAGALKVMPAIFIPYLLLRMRFRAGLAALGSLVVFTFSPGFVFGFPRLLGYFRDWPRAVGLNWGMEWQNQSVYAMVDRFVGYGVTPFNASEMAAVLAVRTAPSGKPIVLVVTAVLIGAIALAAMLVSRRRGAPDSPATMAEYGIVFIMSVVFCPLTWKSYLVVMTVPVFFLAGVLWRGFLPPAKRSIAVAGLIAYFVLAGLTPSGIVGRQAAAVLQTLSVPTIAALIILGVLILIRPALSVREKISRVS